MNNKYFGPKLNGINLQDAGNIFMENILYFHNFLLCILLMIVVLVCWFLIRTLLFFGNPILAYNFYLKSQIFYKNFMLYLDIILYYLYIFQSWVSKVIDYFIILFNIWRLKSKVKLPKFPTLNLYISSYYRKLYLDDVNYFVFFFNDIKFGFYNIYNTSNKYIFYNNLGYRYYFYSDVLVEFLWTLFPAIILGVLAIPSFSLLFSIQKYNLPELTVKVIGHQWYWEYQFMDYIKVNKFIINNNGYILNIKNKDESKYIIESYMIQDEDLNIGQLRLLEVDNKLILPIETSIRLLITSDDVLHSWAVPSLGIKLDACPGRINELVINIRNIGTYYGQCSELCGWYHGFMPIAIQSLQKSDFKFYVSANFLDFVVKKSDLRKKWLIK